MLLHRIKDNGKATLGILVLGDLTLFTLEDEHRNTKVPGETRIPSGRYKIIKCYQSSLLYRMQANGWYPYSWIPTIENVPGFTNIRIHAGNTEKHTDGCPLVGFTADLQAMTIGRSRSALLKFVEKLETCFNDGDVYLTITDER